MSVIPTSFSFWQAKMQVPNRRDDGKFGPYQLLNPPTAEHISTGIRWVCDMQAEDVMQTVIGSFDYIRQIINFIKYLSI